MKVKILNDLNEDIIAIRTEAFVVGRNVPKEVELDGCDHLLLHFCLYDGDILLSYLRAEQSGEGMHLGRVTTRAEVRRRGYGRMLMDYVACYAKEKGCHFLELHAVDTAVGFYEKLGFSTHGEYFMETGVPHIYMKKPLQ
ncbi:MAG: GNAT family N-acetyltransferase [Clostridia bacterium]|nr:GNAT family N-acetyltransferase [Clostridia bacterium]